VSLDVYLNMPGYKQEASESKASVPKIFIRDNGQTKEISREEWDKRFPGRVPVTVQPGEAYEVFSANITHNLTKMAEEAGIYEAVWRPEEVGITKASQLIMTLKVGLAILEQNPTYFKTLNPPNDWGNYEVLILFVEDYLDACIKYPNANVRISR